MPRVSVVIPSYNHEAYVGEAVASVLDGPFEDLELIVVDDGSTDASVDVLRSVDDERLRWYTQENQGAHAALNRGLELARGEYVFILNSDDVFAPQRISRFVDFFDAFDGIPVLTSWLTVIDAEGRALGVKEAWRNMPPWPPPRRGKRLSETGNPHLALLESNYVSTTSNVAVRKKFLDDGLRFRPLRYVHDWEFLLRSAVRGTVGVLEDSLLSYRVHGSNTIREGEAERQGLMRFEILWVVARYAQQILRQEETDLRRRAWNSLPRFGCESLLLQLLALRGGGEDAPASYDALLDEEHPLRRAAVRALSEPP